MVAFDIGLRFLGSPEELGITSSDTITFTALFKAVGPIVAPIATPTPTRVFEGVPEGTLVIAVPNLGRESFNPKANSGVDRNYLKFIFDILVGSDADGNLDKSFGIAEDWEMSSDAMKWTFRYRKGIEFSNGDEVTAEDTKFVLSLVMAEDSRSTYKNVFVNAFGSVDNVNIPDPPHTGHQRHHTLPVAHCGLLRHRGRGWIPPPQGIY